MGRNTFSWLIVMFLAAWPMGAPAQTDERDYLTALLEDNLSGAGRQVVITGFTGALSSQARIETLTIADEAGVWITLNDIVLDWQRSDLLAGKVTVSQLTAAEISLWRIPSTQAEVNAEAPSFALPELPIAINIGALAVEKLHLAAPVLGQEINASAAASMQLAAGRGQGSITLRRGAQDSAQGQADIDVAFSNAERWLRIDLAASEGVGGILAQVLGIPGAPALEFTVSGDAPLDDFTANLALRSDGQKRFGGQISWASIMQDGEGAPKWSQRFDVDLSGDPSPLVQAEFRPFFGQQTRLRAQGQTRDGGGFDMPIFALTSAGMDLSGQLSLGPTGQPDAFSLRGQWRDPQGGMLTLPLALDSSAAISSAQISADFDATKGDEFTVLGQLQNWQQEALRLSNSQFAIKGRIAPPTAGAGLRASISFSAEGIQPKDAALSRALGPVIWGEGDIAWQQGSALTLNGLGVMGEDYEARLNGQLTGLDKGLTLSGEIAVSAQNFSRFSGLLGQPIAGSGQLGYSGDFTFWTRAFDGTLTAQTNDLALGIGAVDAALKGEATAKLSARRDAAGIDLRQFKVTAAGFDAWLAGKVAASGTDLAGEFTLLDMPLSARGFAGQMTGKLAVSGAPNDAMINLTARSNGLQFASPYLTKISDQEFDFSAKIALAALSPRIESIALSSPMMRLGLRQLDGGNAYQITAEMADLGLIEPKFSGPFSLLGTALPQDDGAQIDVQMRGPAGLAADVRGAVSLGQSNDLQLMGRVDAALINILTAPRSISGDVQFDLRLRGALELAALSGSVNVTSGHFVDPSLPFALREAALAIELRDGLAQISGKTNASTGGKLNVTGAIATRAPFDGDLAIGVAGLGLHLPALVQSTIDGKLTLNGPVLGGAKIAGTLNLGRTEVQLRVPNVIEGAALPDLRHNGDTAAVQATRARAGFDARTDLGAAPNPYDLNILLRAPNRIFVRGRGLDAELGGEVRLQGDSSNVRPNGSFDLVQGHFNILTTRLNLEEVRLEMRGEFVPYLSVRATNSKSGIITTAIIDGPALDPDFSFASAPELPEEEVLSQLLFDQSLQNLTALQTVQLASAVVSLTGRGEGLIARGRKTLRLDNLDVQSDEAGNTALKLGKYTSKDVYSELSSEGLGKQSLEFTYTLNEKIKLRLGGETNGNTSLGVEFETNY